jgi:membrane protein
MGLTKRSVKAARRNVPAILAGLALAGTYALALSQRERASRQAAAAAEIAEIVDVPAPAITPPAAPMALTETGWPFWKHVIYRTVAEISDDRLLALAAGVVFYGLLALFPAVTALVSSYALFADTSTNGHHLALIGGLMPESAYSIVNEQVGRIVSKGTGTLGFTFFFGLALALWSANAGAKAIIDALNIVYGVKERRGFIKLNLVSLAFTVGAIASLLLAIAAIVVLPVALSYLPFAGSIESALRWARWPVLFLLLMAALAVLYRFGPDNPDARWQWISPGATFAAVAWLAGSALLSWYLGSFAHYDKTYGSLGAGIGLMMWLWMTAIVVLVGAEFNSEIDVAHGIVPRAEARIDGAVTEN